MCVPKGKRRLRDTSLVSRAKMLWLVVYTMDKVRSAIVPSQSNSILRTLEVKTRTILSVPAYHLVAHSCENLWSVPEPCEDFPKRTTTKCCWKGFRGVSARTSRPRCDVFLHGTRSKCPGGCTEVDGYCCRWWKSSFGHDSITAIGN